MSESDDMGERRAVLLEAIAEMSQTLEAIEADIKKHGICPDDEKEALAIAQVVLDEMTSFDVSDLPVNLRLTELRATVRRVQCLAEGWS